MTSGRRKQLILQTKAKSLKPHPMLSSPCASHKGVWGWKCGSSHSRGTNRWLYSRFRPLYPLSNSFPISSEWNNGFWRTFFYYDRNRITTPRPYIGKYCFVNRTIKLWNRLPAEALATFPCKPHIFRKGVRKVITSQEKWRVFEGWWRNVRKWRIVKNGERSAVNWWPWAKCVYYHWFTVM
jgi:hypothetical protein